MKFWTYLSGLGAGAILGPIAYARYGPAAIVNAGLGLMILGAACSSLCRCEPRQRKAACSAPAKANR